MINMNEINTIFIISKNRPHCLTAKLLEKLNYSGDWFICVQKDDEDIEEYYTNFSKKIITYDYHKTKNQTDMLDNFSNETGGAAPARNAVLKIAEDLNLKRFWLFDDDFLSFTIPKPHSKSRTVIKQGTTLEKALNILANFGEKTNQNIGFCVDMSRYPPSRGDINFYIRGAYNLKTDSLKFRSRMEEDLCFNIDTYHNIGAINIAFKILGFTTKGSSSEKGGLTDLYEKEGGIRRGAYNILISPHSTVKKDIFGYSGFPKWRYYVPKIVNEKYRK